MKKHLISITILILLLAACNKPQTNEIIIEGQVKGFADNAPISLTEKNSDTSFLTDTIRDGKFSFVFQDSIQGGAREIYINIYDGQPVVKGASIWIATPATIKINMDEEYPFVWHIESNVAEQIESNKYLEKTLTFEKQKSNKLKEINNLLKTTEDPKNMEQVRAVSASMAPIRDSIETIFLNMLEKEKTYSPFWHDQFFRFVQDSYRSKEDNNTLKERLVALYKEIPEDKKDKSKLEDIEFFLFTSKAKVLEIGDKFVDAELKDVDDKTQHIADYSGKYRLLDFWATWCGPCIAAGPELKEIANKYKDKLVVITINSEEKDTWLKYSKNKEMAGINLHNNKADRGIIHFYNIEGIPHYVLIAPNDTIVDIWKGYGKGSLHERIQKHLGK